MGLPPPRPSSAAARPAAGRSPPCVRPRPLRGLRVAAGGRARRSAAASRACARLERRDADLTRQLRHRATSVALNVGGGMASLGKLGHGARLRRRDSGVSRGRLRAQLRSLRHRLLRVRVVRLGRVCLQPACEDLRRRLCQHGERCLELRRVRRGVSSLQLLHLVRRLRLRVRRPEMRQRVREPEGRSETLRSLRQGVLRWTAVCQRDVPLRLPMLLSSSLSSRRAGQLGTPLPPLAGASHGAASSGASARSATKRGFPSRSRRPLAVGLELR